MSELVKDIQYKKVFPRGSGVANLYNGPSRDSGVRNKYAHIFQKLNRKRPIGTPTGKVDRWTMGNPWYEVFVMYNPDGSKTPAMSRAWVDGNEVELRDENSLVIPTQVSTPGEGAPGNSTVAEAQQVVNELVSTQKKLYLNILGLDKSIREAKRAGKNVSSEEALLKDLVKGWARREVELRNNNSVKVTTKPVNKLQEWISSFGNLGQIGELISATMLTGIVVGALVVVALASLALAVFRPLLAQSKADLNTSGKAWDAVKKKLTEKEQVELEKDVKDQIDDAYQQGSAASNWGWLKTAAGVGLAFIVIRKVAS